MTEYTHRAMWSPNDQSYVGTCLEFPGLRGRGQTAGGAITEVEKLVNEDVALAVGTGWTPPESLTDREYSGRFVVRMSPELHAHLAVESAEQGVSLNHWVLQKLVNRSRPPGF